jgi:GNAT superfamily N-acetyltransferase
MSLTLRKAVSTDVPQLRALIDRSARILSREDYRPAQIEGALRGAFGVDSQLLRDETYFLVEDGGECVGCGGWSYRATLFGGDAHAERDASVLDPKTQAAKIRAFFVDPDHARRGIGSMLLEHCESEARSRGFTAIELMATLPGVKLYSVRGYIASPVVNIDLGQGETIEFVPMRKALQKPV